MTSMNSHSGRGCDGVTGRFPYFSSHKKLQLTPSHTVTLVPSSGGPSVKRGAPQRRKCSPVSQSLPVAGARASSEGPPRNEPTVPTRPAPLPYGRGTGRTQFQETQPEGDGPPCGTSLDLPCGNFPSSAEGGRGIPWRRPPRAVPALWRLQPQQRRTDWHDIWDHHTSQATRAGAWCALARHGR